MEKKISFIIKGNIKKIGKLEKDIKNCFSKFFSLELIRTKQKSDGINLALSAINNSTNFLIAIGGDGTINEVINGYMQADKEKRNKVVVGLLPRGTGNDFARTIKMEKNLEYLLFLIQNNLVKKIDVGKINYTTFEGQPASRFFNNVADMGIGAETVRIVNGSSKYLGSMLTFFFATLRVLLTYKHQPLKIILPDKVLTKEIVTLCFANGKYFGSGLGVAPAAAIDDGFFDVVSVVKLNTFHFLKYVPTIRKCKPINIPEVNYSKTKSCRVESNGEMQFPIETDGEYIGTTPLTIEVIPSSINFLMK